MIQILKNIPFFSELADEDLQAIVDNVKMEYFPAEHMIFEEGSFGDIMYIIKRGTVEVVREKAIIAELSNDSFFGEMALVSEEPRNATIKTKTDVEALTLSKEDFKHLLGANPNIASMVSYEVIKRINANS